MILVTSGPRDVRAFSSCIQFARQLAGLGLSVAIDENSVPETLDQTQKFEAVRFLSPINPSEVDHVLIIGAQAISDDLLRDLHRHGFGISTRVTAIGRFATAQARLGAQSKLAYAIGREPDVLDLGETQPEPFVDNAIAPAVFSSSLNNVVPKTPRLLIYMPKKRLKGNRWLGHLEMLSNSPHFDCQIISEAQGKNRVLKSRFNSIGAYSISELAPETIAQMADILVFFGENIPGERMATLALECMGKGGALLDCTERASFSGTGAPVIRGSTDIAGLSGFLQRSVLPNLAGIRQQMGENPWLEQRKISTLLAELGIKFTKPKLSQPKGRAIFVPTNGVGLGHAQRCSQIAGAMKNRGRVGFAAFPSCISMLQSKGFDCQTLASKSDSHQDPFANDLLNYVRLSKTVTANDHLIFDGSYVFTGIYRTILENQLSATWIRRGLWQAGQADRTPMEREKAFDQVIIPEEIFAELNTDYSFGENIHKVGPIAQKTELSAAAKLEIRSKLARKFDRPFDKLVVTMLGGGVAADRSAQLQILASQFQSRADCLHLVVVWPNSTISASLFGWDNTHVVRTNRALELCQASDFVISAAGYNSFNEILYHQIPSILVPQMAGFMDNQERRALAASDRGLAVTVMADQLLGLRQNVDAFLDGKKTAEIAAALAENILPERGNTQAARLIEGLQK